VADPDRGTCSIGYSNDLSTLAAGGGPFCCGLRERPLATRGKSFKFESGEGVSGKTTTGVNYGLFSEIRQKP
jgi:hypothetical protein